MSKNIMYNQDARYALESGMNILAQAVSVTLGPKGKNVLLGSKYGTPQIVNDGITVAKEIELKNPIENMGVMLMRQAALKTNEVVGDGTTTATVLAYAIIKEGMQSISAGGNPVLIKKGIDKAVNFIINKISEYAKPVIDIKDIRNIASISAGNNTMIGSIIARAIKQIGREGIISLEEGQSTITSIDITDGMSFNQGYMSTSFLSDPMQLEIRQENPFILLVDKKIKAVQKELISLLEQVASTGRPLLIIAEEIEQEVLSTLVLNRLKCIIDVVAVRTPGFGDRREAFLEDIAILTNATVISDKLGLNLDKSSFDLMGSAKHTVISKNKTTIISDKHNKALKLRCNSLRKQIELSSNNYEKEKLQERLAKLSGGIAVIKIGAATSTEMNDNKLRFEDAINATRAALEEGVVPGGGATLMHLSESLNLWASRYLLSDELIGAKIIVQALLVPLHTIVENTGNNGCIVIDDLRNTNFNIGYDADKSQVVNMYSVGIIDSAKVTRLVIQNASSIASMILMTECIISNTSFQPNL